MGPDDLFKVIFSGLTFVLAGVTAFLAVSVINCREKLVENSGKIKTLEDKVAKLESSQLTPECITEAIDKALDKRDKVAEERRAEWNRLHVLEMRELVHKEFKALVPEIVRELHERGR